MYKAVTTQKELVNLICDNIKKNNIRCVNTDEFGNPVPVEPDYGIFVGFQNIPIACLTKMATMDISRFSDFRNVYAEWGKAGLLRFDPYMLQDKGVASLCVRHNRYIHMFRGHHFQASGTISGIGSHGNGSYRTDFLTHTPYHSLLEESLLGYILWWAALIDVGFNFDNFKEKFSNDVEPIQDFLHETMRNWNYGIPGYCWKDVEKCIKTKAAISSEDFIVRKVYQLSDGGKVYARFAIGEKTVMVEVHDTVFGRPRVVYFEVPEYDEGVVTNEIDSDDLEDLKSTFTNNHYLEMILVMLLNLCGVHINFINWYPTAKLVPLQPLNMPGIKSVQSLNDIYKAEPDTF